MSAVGDGIGGFCRQASPKCVSEDMIDLYAGLFNTPLKLALVVPTHQIL
ncbi:MAG: hypothetical protein FWB93_03030 [Oscillospiraceae bacterium]|nr:hypothetical protein [Oscillospiraceae bacterium]